MMEALILKFLWKPEQVFIGQTGREQWNTEFDNMHEKQAWTIITHSSVPSNRKNIGKICVYVQIDEGRYRSRTVAKEFTQITSKDFQENHSPVVNDNAFRTILVLRFL
jgi:hypothetical protein